jgi:putative endonuclease
VSGGASRRLIGTSAGGKGPNSAEGGGTSEGGPGAGGKGEGDPGAGGKGERPLDGRRALGAEGEALAERWYEAHGYEILDRNWRRREGEVDLIVRKGKTVAFCEVKTRSTDRFGSGAESVLQAKQRRIRRLASRWLSELTPASGRAGVDVRFDVVAITSGTVEVIEDAF